MPALGMAFLNLFDLFFKDDVLEPEDAVEEQEIDGNDKEAAQADVKEGVRNGETNKKSGDDHKEHGKHSGEQVQTADEVLAVLNR